MSKRSIIEVREALAGDSDKIQEIACQGFFRQLVNEQKKSPERKNQTPPFHFIHEIIELCRQLQLDSFDRKYQPIILVAVKRILDDFLWRQSIDRHEVPFQYRKTVDCLTHDPYYHAALNPTHHQVSPTWSSLSTAASSNKSPWMDEDRTLLQNAPPKGSTAKIHGWIAQTAQTLKGKFLHHSRRRSSLSGNRDCTPTAPTAPQSRPSCGRQFLQVSEGSRRRSTSEIYPPVFAEQVWDQFVDVNMEEQTSDIPLFPEEDVCAIQRDSGVSTTGKKSLIPDHDNVVGCLILVTPEAVNHKARVSFPGELEVRMLAVHNTRRGASSLIGKAKEMATRLNKIALNVLVPTADKATQLFYLQQGFSREKGRDYYEKSADVMLKAFTFRLN